MTSFIRWTLRFALLVSVVFASFGCKVSGEFDPDQGRKDDDKDTVYRTPTPLPQ